MQIIVLEEAEQEITDAVLWYEERADGLGAAFENEVNFVFRAIACSPELPRLRTKGYRRVNLKRFPFYVAYMIYHDAVIILAIGHGARLPEYWIGRKP